MIQFRDEEVAIDAIDRPSAPLREQIDPEYIGRLADSIGSIGLLQPVGLRGPFTNGRYEVVWGDCRTQAVRLLGWPSIPARVCDASVLPGDARAAENLQRQELNPREEANEVKRLHDEGKPLVHIARTLRRSVTWVESRLELLRWPIDVQDRVARGELTMSAARLLGEIDHDSYRASLLDEIRRTGASSNIIAVWVAHYHADRERIIRNQETVEQIMGRREVFQIMFDCECCGARKDTRVSVLLRICDTCKQTLDDEKAESARAQAQENHPQNGR
jgi:ParB family chromosome partitioning protein